MSRYMFILSLENGTVWSLLCCIWSNILNLFTVRGEHFYLEHLLIGIWFTSENIKFNDLLYEIFLHINITDINYIKIMGDLNLSFFLKPKVHLLVYCKKHKYIS